MARGSEVKVQGSGFKVSLLFHEGKQTDSIDININNKSHFIWRNREMIRKRVELTKA